MSLFSSLLQRVQEYVGPRILPEGDSFNDGFERRLVQQSPAITRWHLADLEAAIIQADAGNLKLAGQMARTLRRDGTVLGVLSTRTEGMVQLPLRFVGDDPDILQALADDFRSVFPLAELALLLGDGIFLGVGVGEFVQQSPAHLPVLRRLDPTFLQYRQSEDRWYYQSVHGFLPINPGDGRWVLHCPGGALTPWTNGIVWALGRSYIAKDHAFYQRENYGSKLANSARVGESPAGATDAARNRFFAKIAAWGVNTVFDLPPGWKVSLLESNGKGYEVYDQTIKTSNEEIQTCIAGQTVTTTGGSGFQNNDIHKTIKAELIQAGADTLADTLERQAIPVWVNERFGSGSMGLRTRAEWDVTPPKDVAASANAVIATANGAKAMNDLLAFEGKRVDTLELSRRVDIPLADGAAPTPPAQTSTTIQ